jgi:outer membrane protein assembly factor BamB
MSTHLEDRIWQELAQAAEREARRGRLARGRRAVRAPSLRPALGAAAAAVAVALAAVVIAVVGRPDPPSTPAGPDVEVVQIGRGLGAASAGSGAVWTYDIPSGRVLRVDPASRRVVADVRVVGIWNDVAIAAGAGAVWAVPTRDTHAAPTPPARPVALARIDPRTNRITERIAMRMPGGEALVPVGVTASDGAVWVWGQAGVLRVDPGTDRVTRALTVPGDNIKGFHAGADGVWAATENGRIVRFDPRSGERIAAFDGPVVSRTLPLVVLPGLIVVGDQAGTTLGIDPGTGQERWRARIGSEIRAWATAGGRLWILTASDSGPGYQLLALDPGTGRATARVALPGAGARALVSAGGALWATLQDGRLAVVGG